MHIWITVMTISEQLQSERLHTNMFQLFNTVQMLHHWHEQLTRTHTALHFWTYYDDLRVLVFTEITHKSMKYSGVQMLKHFKGCLI